MAATPGRLHRTVLQANRGIFHIRSRLKAGKPQTEKFRQKKLQKNKYILPGPDFQSARIFRMTII